MEDIARRQLQLKRTSQGGQEPLDTEVDDATLLQTATRQRGCEH
jgi:hypothetical protein